VSIVDLRDNSTYEGAYLTGDKGVGNKFGLVHYPHKPIADNALVFVVAINLHAVRKAVANARVGTYSLFFSCHTMAWDMNDSKTFKGTLLVGALVVGGCFVLGPATLAYAFGHLFPFMIGGVHPREYFAYELNEPTNRVL
jgi:hypothetical protein